jgi:hypothetical protein
VISLHKRGWILPLLLALLIARLWLMPLPSSFWVDEEVTAFVVHYGPDHASFAVAPQVTRSVYYALPRAAEAVLGFSEISYRLPSILMMALALFLIARLAARLIHPDAVWFAVFACLALRGINYEAADARPYALGMCATAAAFLFLVRWLDFARWIDALLFVVLGALVWRVHLVFWPIYIVFALYAVVRIAHRETTVQWPAALGIFALIGLTLIPVVITALGLFREAGAHVIVDVPETRELRNSLKLGLLAVGAGVLLIGWWFQWRREDEQPSWGSWALIAGWWLVYPSALYVFSIATGNSVFVPRYLSLGLPGAALAATLLAAPLVPRAKWKPLAIAFGLGVLLFMGQWRTLFPPHHNSDWRAAARAINRLSAGLSTPVICPSPFIEARAPVWSPDYPLPGFLYSYLPVYPIQGRPYLLPFEPTPEAEQYAATLSSATLPQSGRFFIFGGDRNVNYWTNWFAAQPDLRDWKHRALGPFGDVEAVLFERP